MSRRCVVVLDVGKTNAKLTLWDAAGRLLDRADRANRSALGPGYRALDAEGIEAWLAETLSRFAAAAEVGAIVPVAHGAACALVADDRLLLPPLDYEDDGDAGDRSIYDGARDAFSATGSPALPQGLNLGWQLHRLERAYGPWPAAARILTWPQYWAWRLSGVMACEVSSLGCHTDLWRPVAGRPSALAFDRGWAARLAPLRRAEEQLGVITPDWARRTGLPADCAVLCGLHDSNAALLAARGHAEIAGTDATVLSTGTWFVAMRAPAQGQPVGLADLAPDRDGLVNVDVTGGLVPSARFMGGREIELLGGLDAANDADLEGRVAGLLRSGVRLLPGFVPGVGPYPHSQGRWENEPSDRRDRRAAVGVYIALMADAILDLVGSRQRLVIEGRFAESAVFTRVLAALRPGQTVHTCQGQDDVAYGALRLLDPGLPPPAPLTRITPLNLDLGDLDLSAFAQAWRRDAEATISTVRVSPA